MNWKQAFERLNKEDIERALETAQDLNVTEKDQYFLNGYPAKRVIRRAWELKYPDEEVDWNGAGGKERTQKFLESFGFEIEYRPGKEDAGSMTEKFKWIDFYTEFASKLLDYKDNRSQLISKLQNVYAAKGMKLPKLEKTEIPIDIDPFTVFGLFNKGITTENRISVLDGIKTEFGIEAEVPDSFDSIPVLNNMKATFYGFEGDRKEHDIDNLWIVLETALALADQESPDTRAAFQSAYDAVLGQLCVRWNITMGLYWVRPYCFINLDSRNRWFMGDEENISEAVANKVAALKKVPSASAYLEIRDGSLAAAQTGKYSFSNFPELSYSAWKASHDAKQEFEEDDSPLLLEFVERFISEYPTEKQNAFAENDFGKYIRATVPKNIFKTGIVNQAEYSITGSVGQGNWVTIPWVAIFDKRVTKSAQKGEYIVYLLSLDQKTLYLTFNQGCTDLSGQFGKKKTLEILQDKVSKARQQISSRGFSTAPIDLAAPGEDKAQMYEAGCIFSKAYIIDNLPSEEELREDLKNMVDIYQEYVTKFGDMVGSAPTQGDEFWPSNDEYPVNLTKEDWKRFLEEIEYPNHKGCIRVLKCFLDRGGVASPKKLSDTYGGHSMVYTSSVSNTSRRALKYFDMKPCPDKDTEWLFPIAFLGKRGTGKDSGTYVYKMRDELLEALKEMDLDDIELEYRKGAEEEMDASNYGLNTILYGPPGTGKTYKTARIAVSICEPDLDVVSMDRQAIMEKYNELKAEGRIEFTTFHQSYGYEEFIEGIKPVISDDEDTELEYTIEPGVFKEFCDRATVKSVGDENTYGLNAYPNVWKVSLYGSGENEIRSECMKNGHIRIGWDEYGEDISDVKFSGGQKSVRAFINRMQIGDFILSCYNGTSIDAIGVVTGDYEWDDSYPQYKRVRKVNWIVKGIQEDIVQLNGGRNLMATTIYKMKLSSRDVLGLLDRLVPKDTTNAKTKDKNYVFIIDEINRGNVSKIFGELITLIEDTKRIGSKEGGMTVRLPYSGESFGVPNNVYILGTMNTADRSIALMDTALRRRFNFEEMMPDTSVIKGITVTEDGETLDVADMLETINKRIKYLYDREHTIGHAFFTPLMEDNSMATLAGIFKNKVIPLLQEYFYEDYEKIQLVLGDDAKSNDKYKFIHDDDVKESTIFKTSPQLDLHDKTYEIQDEAFGFIQSYIEIKESRKPEVNSEEAD